MPVHPSVAARCTAQHSSVMRWNVRATSDIFRVICACVQQGKNTVRSQSHFISGGTCGEESLFYQAHYSYHNGKLIFVVYLFSATKSTWNNQIISNLSIILSPATWKLHNECMDWSRQQIKWDLSVHSIFIRDLQEAEVTFLLINCAIDIIWVDFSHRNTRMNEGCTF